MSQTTASLESHPIRAQFETLGEAITESLGADALPATVRPELLRSRSVLARLGFLVDNADPAFVDDTFLTNAQRLITNLGIALGDVKSTMEILSATRK